MAAISNATIDAPGDNWRVLGVVMGVAVVDWEEVKTSSAMVVAAREFALDCMNENAKRKGADAVVGIRFDSVIMHSQSGGLSGGIFESSATDHTIEYTAYGTAVKFDYPPIAKQQPRR